MSGTRTGELLDAIAARCDRLVSGAVRDPAERRRQRRLIGVALGAPFLIAAATAILLTPLVGVSATLVVGGSIFAISFLAAVGVATTGRACLAGLALLFCGVPAFGTLVGAAGGIASPAALVVGAFVFEAWWVRRSSAAALAGTAAALAALALPALPSAASLAGEATPNAAHWLIPIAYLALTVPRIVAWLDETGEVVGTGPRPLDEIIEGVVVHMDLSGEITDASAQSRRILGLAPELLLSSGLFDRLHVADRVAYLCALADLKQACGYRRVEARIRVPGAVGSAAQDFRAFDVEMTHPENDSTITLLLRASDRPGQGSTAAEAEKAMRGELAKTRMLAAVSHELRTPLNSIIGFSDMLLHEMAGGFADPRQKEYVGLVRESGNHLLSVVNSILDVSRLEAGAHATHAEPFRFSEAVETCRAMLARQASDRKLTLTTDIAAEIGEVHADKRAVKQMLINLVSNAIKFTPEGGAVSVGAKRIGTRLHFWVSDTGIGIPEEDLARIGEPYVQVRDDYTRQFDGTGLGLSLVKGLVALHGGSMTIDSEPGRGTTVTISLPVDRPQPVVVESPETRAIAANISQEAYDGTYRKTA
ncbi:sensor histidine kinase [Mesorhizobium sp. ZMM04-4]